MVNAGLTQGALGTSNSLARRIGVLTWFAGMFACGPAHAHVKWFADFDLTKPPLPVGEVLDGQFVAFFLSSVILIYGFFFFDRFVLRTRLFESALGRCTISESVAASIMRGAAFAFFAAVGAYGLSGQAFFLTPELRTDLRWVPWLHLGMALCALYWRTLPLVGLGAAFLYVVAAYQYGIFHLLDYLILIGVSYYFLAAPLPGTRWLTSRYVTLYATTAVTLMWAAVEKWGYPAWTYPLLARDPGLLMGFAPATYMLLAGFVEFNLTFMLLSGASLLARVVALGLGAVFILAIYKFGLIDAVGHLLIIAILTVLVLHGPTKARAFLVLEQKSLWTEAYFMTGLYVFAFVIIFIGYYGLHALFYGE